MGRHFLIMLCLCFLALRESHASCAPEDYWKHKLPATSMPQSIKDSLIPTGGNERRETTANSAAALSSEKNSPDSTNAYGGLLSYTKPSTEKSPDSTNAYGGLLSYASTSTEKSPDTTNAYGGLLSYASTSTEKSPDSTNAYGGLLSYASTSTEKSPDSTNAYGGLLSYASTSPRKMLAGTNGYGGLLSYAKVSTAKDSLDKTNAYGGLLSYARAASKNSVNSANAYGGLLSYAKTSTESSPAKTNAYGGLLSYAKASTKNSVNGANAYGGLLSYAKASVNGANAYGGLLSYAKTSTESSPAKTNAYGGLLSYAKESPKCNDKESPSTAANIMEDQAFFVEADLHHGKKMDLIFKKGNNKAIFLPREVANNIPFSSDKLPEIYNILSLDPKSQDAYIVSRRIELCEEPKVEGVQKKCVTSLESMVDFVVSKIGSNVKALTTDVDKDYPKMEYTIKEVRKISKNDHETVVCHKIGYPYALFFCHGTDTIRSYMVSLVGNDGTKIEAVAACHKETNDFLSNYMVNVLKVVPGSTRVCHFPGAQDNIIWVAN